MSTRTAKLGLGWLSNVVGQVVAVAAVPAAIVLAMGLEPQPDGDKRTEPFWENPSHARNCPACQLLIHQARSPGQPLPAEPPVAEPIALRPEAAPVEGDAPARSVL
jgi:hypothetical protein